MKFNLLSLMLAVVVVFTAVSCTPSQYATDDRYDRDRQIGNRVYIDDPYRGTVVLERDPYTGRYYDVTNSYGYGYGSRYSPYGYSPYDYDRRYSRSYDRTYQQQRPQETQQQREDRSNRREDARRKVLGN